MAQANVAPGAERVVPHLQAGQHTEAAKASWLYCLLALRMLMNTNANPMMMTYKEHIVSRPTLGPRTRAKAISLRQTAHL